MGLPPNWKDPLPDPEKPGFTLVTPDDRVQGYFTGISQRLGPYNAAIAGPGDSSKLLAAAVGIRAQLQPFLAEMDAAVEAATRQLEAEA